MTEPLLQVTGLIDWKATTDTTAFGVQGNCPVGNGDCSCQTGEVDFAVIDPGPLDHRRMTQCAQAEERRLIHVVDRVVRDGNSRCAHSINPDRSKSANTSRTVLRSSSVVVVP